MGEAKRRKESDPYFGMKPKNGRGIFLSAPVAVGEDGVFAASSSIDPAELRRAALFWDRLVWPESQIISFGSNEDENLLISEGLLLRPKPTRFNLEAGVGSMLALVRVEGSSQVRLGGNQWIHFARQHVEEYLSWERREPGQWILSTGENAFFFKDENFVNDRGQLLALSQAVPLPSANFPIHELLEFKVRRQAEIIAFNAAIDSFYSNLMRSSDRSFEFQRLLRVIDKSCADMIAAAKESKWAFKLGDVELSFSIDSIESGFARAAAWEAAVKSVTSLPIVGAVAGTLASCLSISRGFGARRLTRRDTPFAVVARMHRELR